jgi:hypothetical protein
MAVKLQMLPDAFAVYAGEGRLHLQRNLQSSPATILLQRCPGGPALLLSRRAFFSHYTTNGLSIHGGHSIIAISNPI